MQELRALLKQIIQRANIKLRATEFDIAPYVEDLVQLEQMVKFYAFYGITPHHPLNFNFINSNLSGSYFLGKCRVTDSILYKSDIRGDELKQEGDTFHFKNLKIPLNNDEEININDSYLIKTLVHNFSHDPESVENFFIKDTISAHYANIHGSPTDGCFLGPFSTIDLTTVRDCLINTFSYVQAGEISHININPGTIWVKSPESFNFLYQYPVNALKKYIHFSEGTSPQGLFIDFIEDRKEAFQRGFETVTIDTDNSVPNSASLDRFAVVKPKTHIGENVLISQREYIQNSSLGKGSNAQENCYIIN
jgi:hypothetical protein